MSRFYRNQNYSIFSLSRYTKEIAYVFFLGFLHLLQGLSIETVDDGTTLSKIMSYVQKQRNQNEKQAFN
jgi:hypothetical protein